MRKKINILFIILPLVFFAACKPEFDAPKYSAGNAVFTRYVAIGSSLTAGYSDGALYREAQENSFPAILARQFALVGGGPFKQPLMNPGAGLGVISPPLTFTAKLKLDYVNSCGETILHPEYDGSADVSNIGGSITNIPTIYPADGPFNNFGIPGAKSFDFDDPNLGFKDITVYHGNPYYARIASQQGVSTMIDDAIMIQPTFFSMWLGVQDVYGYAISGGEGGDSITTATYFSFEVDEHLDKLTAVAKYGVVANIPEMASIPYFNTIPYNGLVLTSQNDVNALNTLYSSAGITFHLGNNAFIIADHTIAAGARKIKSSEHILLSVPQDSLKCAGWGGTTPIPDEYVLRDVEISNINNAIINFNSKIRTAAESRGLAFVDMDAFFKTLQSGIVFNGVTFNAQFINGGAYSLDGIHPNARGYAMIANEYLRVINARYNSTIPMVDVNAYPGIHFP